MPFKKVEAIHVTHKLCVLVIGESAVSIIHSNNNFHVFDPHNHNKYGLPDINGGSVLLKFSNFNSLSMYIYKLSQSLNTTLYELTPIKITKFKMIESNTNIIKNINTPTAKNKGTITHKKGICQLGETKHSHLIKIQSNWSVQITTTPVHQIQKQ